MLFMIYPVETEMKDTSESNTSHVDLLSIGQDGQMPLL